jgi:hypothetical protein
MRTTLTAARSLPARGAANPFAIGAVLLGVGSLVVLGAVGADTLLSGTGGLALYFTVLAYLALLLWWELTGSAVAADGVLPRWLSPPALICAWTLIWVYGPATLAFFDDRLLDEDVAIQGGPELLLSGALLVGVGVTALSFFYHLTSRLFGRRTATAGIERRASLVRIIGLYLVASAARTLRVSIVGVAFGQDLSAWGSLQWADQWVGYVEDLRYLALALLVVHIVRHGSGRSWLLAALLVEVVFGATAGFLKPLIWPLVVCVIALAAFDRIRGRHVAVVTAGAVVVALFLPVVMAIRENRSGALGSGGTTGTGSALATMGTQESAVAFESAYLKFFSRQSEVAASAGIIMALSPEVIPHEGAQQFLLLPTNLLPRVFWPGKPILSRGRWFAVNFFRLEETTTSSSAMTPFGESYLFFGWTGLIIGMWIIGTTLALLYRFLDRPGAAIVYLALVPTVLELEPELASYLTTIVQRSLVFIVVFFIITHRAKEV